MNDFNARLCPRHPASPHIKNIAAAVISRFLYGKLTARAALDHTWRAHGFARVKGRAPRRMNSAGVERGQDPGHALTRVKEKRRILPP